MIIDLSTSLHIPERVLFRLAADCLPIAERYFINTERLHGLGFKRCYLRLQGLENLCTPEEIEKSRFIWNEIAKELVASYGPRPYPLHWHMLGYKSDYLESLRDQRNKDGLTFDWLKGSGLEEWRYELSPVDRAIRREGMYGSEGSKRRAEEYRKASDKAIEQEITNFVDVSALPNIPPSSSVWSVSTRDELREYRNKYRVLTLSTLTALLENYGFVYSKKLSGLYWFVFLKPIASDIQLRFGFNLNVQSHTWEWHLYVCKSGLPKRPNGPLGNLYNWREHFEIRLKDSVLPNYWSFRSPAELMVCIKAAIAIYSLEEEYISFMLSEIFDPEHGWARRSQRDSP